MQYIILSVTIWFEVIFEITQSSVQAFNFSPNVEKTYTTMSQKCMDQSEIVLYNISHIFTTKKFCFLLFETTFLFCALCLPPDCGGICSLSTLLPGVSTATSIASYLLFFLFYFANSLLFFKLSSCLVAPEILPKATAKFQFH